jgi:hypothetical protein
MSKVHKLKLTLGVKAHETVPPVFMEGEAPGVFAVHHLELIELPEGMSSLELFMWTQDAEREIMKEHVELKWSEEIEDVSVSHKSKAE